MHLKLALHPDRLDASQPILIEELLDLEETGHQDGVSMMILMLGDLHHEGRASRYVQKMTGLPVWELKSASRGGERGGARVYLLMLETGEAGIVNCEIKDGDAPSPQKLKVVLQVARAARNGIPVFRG